MASVGAVSSKMVLVLDALGVVCEPAIDQGFTSNDGRDAGAFPFDFEALNRLRSGDPVVIGTLLRDIKVGLLARTCCDAGRFDGGAWEAETEHVGSSRSFGGAVLLGLVLLTYLSRAPAGISEAFFRDLLTGPLAFASCLFLCCASQSSTNNGTPSFATVSGTHARSGWKGSKTFLGPALASPSSSSSWLSPSSSLFKASPDRPYVAATSSSSASRSTPTTSIGIKDTRSSGVASVVKCARIDLIDLTSLDSTCSRTSGSSDSSSWLLKSIKP